MKPKAVTFKLGNVYMTPGAEDALQGLNISDYLRRHQHGDFGEMCKEDCASNLEDIQTNGRVMSAYTTPSGVKIWLITDAGHQDGNGATTFLLPEEY